MTMHCPLCDRKLERNEYQPSPDGVPSRWVCSVCDCRINEYDDEFEVPDPISDVPHPSP
jgi:transposase-like protein